MLLVKRNTKQVVKVIWHKTASPPQTDGSIVFARWRQCAHRGEHIGATWRIRLNLCFLQHTRVHSPNGKSIDSAISAQLAAESAYTLQWGPFPTKLPLLVGDRDPHLFHDSLSQTEPTIQTASRSVQLFSHKWPQSISILYNGRPFPKNCPFPRGIRTHVRHDSFDPSEPTDQTASLSVQPFSHRWPQSVPYILYNVTPSFPPQNCHFSWRIWTPI